MIANESSQNGTTTQKLTTYQDQDYRSLVSTFNNEQSP